MSNTVPQRLAKADLLVAEPVDKTNFNRLRLPQLDSDKYIESIVTAYGSEKLGDLQSPNDYALGMNTGRVNYRDKHIDWLKYIADDCAKDPEYIAYDLQNTILQTLETYKKASQEKQERHAKELGAIVTRFNVYVAISMNDENFDRKDIFAAQVSDYHAIHYTDGNSCIEPVVKSGNGEKEALLPVDAYVYRGLFVPIFPE